MRIAARWIRGFPIIFLMLGGVSYALLARLSVIGIAAIVALWTLALPLLLRPLGVSLRSDPIAALYVFLTAAYADTLDTVLETQQVATLAIVLLGALYVARHASSALAVVKSPVGITLALFLAQQVASALAFDHPAPLQVVQNRMSVYASLLVVAVMVRRPGGLRLVLALGMVGTLMSVPVMLYELEEPTLLQQPDPAAAAVTRAGGIYNQPNGAGIALAFGLAYALALAPSRATRLTVLAAVVAGVVCTASRGAFAVIILLAVGHALAPRLLRQGRRRPGPAVVGLVLVLALFGPAARLAADAAGQLEDEVPAMGRLRGVLLALGGSTDELADNDSRRGNAAQVAWQMILERPEVGYGTGNFLVADSRGDVRTHVQFLEVLGENGMVGGAFYLLFLLALARAAMRAPASFRLGAVWLGMAWLLVQLVNHNMVEYRFLILPAAILCGAAELHDVGDDPASAPACA